MDSVAGLVGGARADGAFLLRSAFSPPWSFRVRDEAPLSAAVCVTGGAWLATDDGGTWQLEPGDVALLRGPDPYTVAADPSIPPSIFVEPGQQCVDADGVPVTGDLLDPGSRTWGNDHQGRDVLVTGTSATTAAVGDRLLRALPPVVVLARESWSADLVDLLCAEVQRDAPGQDVFLDRLLDLVVLAAVRAWLATDDRAPAWHRAGADRVVGPALTAVHERPEQPWTVASLAAEAGVSRAAFARRFTELVGEPPGQYLTSWRLAVAADLLERTDATIESVARQVGYGSPFALSAAFSRVRGVSPARHRARARVG